jgi:hypothetical protein
MELFPKERLLCNTNLIIVGSALCAPCILPTQQYNRFYIMQKTLFILFIFFLTQNLLAQPGFNTVYNPNPGGSAFVNVLVDTDTTFILYGGTYNLSPPFQQGVWLARMDTMGNIVQEGNYYDPNGRHMASNLNYDIIKDGNDGFVAVGGFLDAVQSTFFISFDHDLNCTGIKEYNNPGFNFATLYNIAPRPNGGYFISGAKVKQNQDYLGHIIALDPAGNTIWEREYGDDLNDEAIQQVFPIEGTTDALVSKTVLSRTPSVNIEPLLFTSIFTVNKLGLVGEEWRSDTLEEGGSISINRLENGDLIYVTRHLLYQTDTPYDLDNYLVCRDSALNLKWKKKIANLPNYPNTTYDLIRSNDGAWLISGQSLVFGTPPNDLNYAYPASYVYKLSATGDSIWQRYFIPNWDLAANESQLFDIGGIGVLPSGSVISAGYIDKQGPTGIRSYPWVVKMNSEGCIDWTSCISSTDDPQQDAPTGKISIVPNPASTETYIILPDIPMANGQWVLYNFAGMPISSGNWQKYERSVQLSLAGLPAGGYYFAVQFEDGSVRSGKLVVQQ